MFELVQNADLAVGSLGIYIVLKCIEDLFESIFFACFAMDGSPDMAIGSTAQILFDFEGLKNMVLNFFTHYYI